MRKFEKKSKWKRLFDAKQGINKVYEHVQLHYHCDRNVEDFMKAIELLSKTKGYVM